jgi:hypothetical protein
MSDGAGEEYNSRQRVGSHGHKPNHPGKSCHDLSVATLNTGVMQIKKYKTNTTHYPNIYSVSHLERFNS